MINGKPVWHFYPTEVPGTYPVEPKDQWKLAYPVLVKEPPKAIVWKTVKEVPPPANTGAVTVYGKHVVLHAPSGAVDQTQIPAGQDGVGYYSNCTYNYHNTYNYTGAIEQAAAAAAAATKAEEETKAKAKAEAEEICITEDDVKIDAMLHEQVQAIHQLHYLHTVDYGAGDVYGRRYTRV